MDPNRINDVLNGRTDVDGIIISWNSARSWYEAVISLSAPAQPDSSVSILFTGVSGLRVREVGPGRGQLPCLRVSDARERQWDRIHYEVEELERSVLHFFCTGIQVLNTPAE
jgi:hypothetical protein